MRRGVVPGVRPVRLQQREHEREEERIGYCGSVVQVDPKEPNRVRPAASLVLRLECEEGHAGLIRLAEQEYQDHHGGDDGDVPPHAHLVEQRDQVDARDVQDEADGQQYAHRDQRPGQDRRLTSLDELGCVAVGDIEGAEYRRHDRHVEELGGGIGDAGHDRELPDQVEPRGPPAPGDALHAARPVVQATGGRICRGHFSHRGRDGQHEEGDERPTDEARRGTCPGEAVVVEDHGAGQDRDDREADGEVAEAAHAAEQLLGVSQLMQVANVLLDGLFARSLRHVGVSLLPTRGWRLEVHPGARERRQAAVKRCAGASFLARGRSSPATMRSPTSGAGWITGL